MSSNRTPARQGSLPSPRDILLLGSTPRPHSHHEISEEAKQSISEVFQLFDLDQDGYLDIFQLQYSLKALGITTSKKDALAYIRKFNPDASAGHEFISQEDFEKLAREKVRTRDPEAELRTAFQHFDTEGIGKITLDSLVKIAYELDQDMSEDELKLMIEEFDYDGDNAINYEEFKRIMAASE